jgi:hypothetical protein
MHFLFFYMQKKREKRNGKNIYTEIMTQNLKMKKNKYYRAKGKKTKCVCIMMLRRAMIMDDDDFLLLRESIYITKKVYSRVVKHAYRAEEQKEEKSIISINII